MDLIQFQQNLKNIRFNDILDDAIVAKEESLLNHNKMQLMFGKGTDGDDLGDYVYDWYAEHKSKYFPNYHAPYGVYNFYKFGSFYDAMYARPLLTAIEVSSTDDKTGYLEKLAGWGNKKLGGQRTFGLTKENIPEYAQGDLKPEIIKRLKEAMFKE